LPGSETVLKGASSKKIESKKENRDEKNRREPKMNEKIKDIISLISQKRYNLSNLAK